MGKTVIMFPGQGVQKIGMSQEFYEKYKVSRDCFEKAENVTGLDMTNLIFKENENLDKTEYTQIALYTAEMAAFYAGVEEGLTFDCAIGLSLGEYSAMTACGAIDFEDCASLVRNRGIYMETAVPDGHGAMAAVIGLDSGKIEEVICHSGLDNVGIANYNCPGQIVITGDKEAVENAAPALKEAGAKRVIPLNVSGPFHSIYLKEAGEKLYQALSEVTLGELKIPYVTNVDASIVTDTTRTKELLKEQVYSSVLWEQSVRAMIADGVDVFVEIGPGKTLSGFMRKIDRNVKMFRIGTMEDIDKTVEAIKEL